jgi:hypothetical protein
MQQNEQREVTESKELLQMKGHTTVREYIPHEYGHFAYTKNNLLTLLVVILYRCTSLLCNVCFSL